MRKIVSRFSLGAWGQAPRSRWWTSPLEVTKLVLQKGQDMLVPRWILELRCCVFDEKP